MNQRMSTQEFEDVYHRYKQLLFRIAFSYVKKREDAEDLVQEAFYKRLYKAPDFADREHEKRWLIRVIVNLSKNDVKSFWHRNRVDMEDVPEQFWMQEEREALLLREVLELPDQCKVPMYLHYYEGYVCREVADILGCKESTIKMRLKKGRELLRFKISEGGMPYED